MCALAEDHLNGFITGLTVVGNRIIMKTMKKTGILIVEDESIVALEIADALKNMGYDVCGQAQSGKEAIEKAGEILPDMILMDINIKGPIDGIETAGMIRDRFNIPIVYLTAYSDERTTRRAKITEPLGYIQKPFKNETLRTTLEMAIYTAGLKAERKSTTDRLKISEKRFQELFSSMIDGYAIHEMLFDENGTPCNYRFLNVNEAFERFTSLKADEIVGKTVLEVLPRTEKVWIETYGEVVQTGRSIRFDSYSVDLGKHFDVSAYRVGENQFACCLMDITKRKKVEEHLARESKTNEALAEISRLLLSSSKNIRSFAEVVLEQVRPITRSQYGYAAILNPETGESELFSFPAIQDEDEIKELMRRSVVDNIDEKTLSNGTARTLTLSKSFFKNHPAESIRIDGTPEGLISVDNYLSVPVYLDNRVSGHIVLINSTDGYSENDLKAVEQMGELFAMAIQGHRMEKEREVLQEQMRQMQKMEAIGTLAGGIAHDFNNILQPIMGYANMALKEIEETDNKYRYLSSILSASKRARDLVQQILTFARRGDQELQPVEVQLIIKEVIKLLRSSLPSTIEMKQKIDKNCGLVIADPTKIHQIIMNLATNAFHALQKTGGLMTVNLKPIRLKIEDLPEDDMIPGEFLCLTVIDNGVGMDRNTLDKIFDPYFTTKRQSKGTGLGLSVVMGAVKSYGGFINVRSEPGEGTEFNVFLPSVEVEPTTVADDDEPAVTMGNENILLVDDESAIVELEKNMLQTLGYHVTESISPVEALKLFEQQSETFDLVITDMTMPNMTGAELARKIMAIQPDLPIIICTGFSELINEEKAESMGIKKLLMKPVSQKQLGSAIREVLDRKG